MELTASSHVLYCSEIASALKQWRGGKRFWHWRAMCCYTGGGQLLILHTLIFMETSPLKSTELQVNLFKFRKQYCA